MRNGTQQIPQTATQSNLAIDQVKGLMAQLKGASDPQAMLAQVLQNNSNTAFIANALKGGTGLEALARQMAQQRGIDINDLIKQLTNS